MLKVLTGIIEPSVTETFRTLFGGVRTRVKRLHSSESFSKLRKERTLHSVLSYFVIACLNILELVAVKIKSTLKTSAKF